MRVRSAKFHIFFCLALALIAPTTTFAQQGDPGCWITRDGTDVLGHTPAYYDEALTRDWYQSLQTADANVMAQIAGVYYTEIPAPQLGRIQATARGAHRHREEREGQRRRRGGCRPHDPPEPRRASRLRADRGARDAARE